MRKHSDSTIARHLAILERVAACHDGVLPPYKWLNEHGYFPSYDVARQYPAAFAHIKTSTDKKYEIYRAQETAKATGVGQILPPAKYGSLAEYHVPGATFHPTTLQIEPGVPEDDWMKIGRALTAVCQSAYWWVGDWLQYGFDTYGKKATFDLAEQATGYTRAQLHECPLTTMACFSLMPARGEDWGVVLRFADISQAEQEVSLLKRITGDIGPA